MARRVNRHQAKILKNLSFLAFTRPLNSSAAASSPAAAAFSAADSPLHLTTTPSATPNIDFADTRALFGSVSTPALLRAAANLHVAAVGPVVDVGMWVMNSRLMEVEVIRDAVLGAVRHSFYQHFCAGEDYAALGNTVRRLNDAGLRSMLDYALEYADDDVACDQNLDGFLRTIESTRSLPPASVSSRSDHPLLFFIFFSIKNYFNFRD